MFLKALVNEENRRINFDSASNSYIAGIVGDFNVDGITFYLPDDTDYFAFSDAVVYVIFFDSNRVSHKQLLSQKDTYSGMPKWAFDNQVLDNDKTSQIVFFLELVITNSSGTVLKSWISAKASVLIHKHPDYDNQEEQAAMDTEIDRLAGLVTELTSKAASIGDVERLLETITGSSPQGAAAVSDLATADPTKLYLVAADGRIYYYLNNQWNPGPVYGSYSLDSTLTQSGQAADAKATGDRIGAVEEDLEDVKEDLNDISDALSYSVTEDIFNSLTFTSGYMDKKGNVKVGSGTLKHSNKIPVKAGDIFNFMASNSQTFRYVTAFSGDSAITDSGAESIPSYTVPDGITDIVVTIYKIAENVKIEHTHDALIDVAELKTDVAELKTDVEHDLSYTHGYFDSTTLRYWGKTNQNIVYFKCKSGVSYKVRKTLSSARFDIAYIKSEPLTGVQQPVYGYVANSNKTTEANFTTGEDALYLLVLLGENENYNAVVASVTITSNEIQLRDDVARTVVTFDEAYLPAHIYLVTGKYYEIYHNQICPNAQNYTFKWSGGTHLGNRVRLKYANVGNNGLKCTIFNADGTKARELNTTVHVVNATTATISLLPLGDSLTNHCVWESELMNLANNITCVGCRSRQVKDSDNETRTVFNEGRAGFTSFNYTNGDPYGSGATDTGGLESPHNRWYDPTAEKFSAEYYFENNFPSDQTDPNMMTIYLGMNDLLGTHTVDEIVDNIQDIIDDILSYDNNMKIVLISPQLRYIPSLTGHEHLLFLDYARKMETMSHNYENIVFLPLPVGMDSKNNYNMTTVSINTRNTLTEQTASDITHPAPAGYWQIADYVLGAISYIANNN